MSFHRQRRQGQLVRYYTSFVLPSSNHHHSTDKYEEQRRQWGGGVRGNKSTAMLRKRAKAAGQTLTAANAQKL